MGQLMKFLCVGAHFKHSPAIPAPSVNWAGGVGRTVREQGRKQQEGGEGLQAAAVNLTRTTQALASLLRSCSISVDHSVRVLPPSLPAM